MTGSASSLCPVKPQTRVRVGAALVVVAIIVGVIGAIVGNWFVVVTMVLAIVGQAVSLIANRRRSGGGRAG
jgi:hypothetical protein